MVDVSNEQQRRASVSIMCKDPFSSATPYAEELEHNIDLLIHHQDIRQCHFPGDQNRAENRYEEEAHSRDEEGLHVYQPDLDLTSRNCLLYGPKGNKYPVEM